MVLRRIGVLAVVLFSLINFADAQRTGPRPRPPTGSSVRTRLPARSFYLAGRVLYGGTMKRAERVQVRLFGSGGSLVGFTFTDNGGEFEFQRLPRAVYIVEVAHEGYDVVRARVDLYLGSRRDTTILLKQQNQPTSKPAGKAVSVRELKIPAKARKAFAQGIRELHEKRRPERSLPHFRQAIELYADYDEAYVQMGLAHLQQQEFDEAQQVLETAIAVYPQNGRALMALGTVYNRQREAEQAVQVLQRAIKLNPHAWQAHYELAKAYLQLRKIEEGYQHAHRAHALHSELPSIHLLVYNLCIARRDYAAALAELDEFLELYPDNPLSPRVRKQRELMRQSPPPPGN